MPYFVAHALDAPGKAEIRAQNRPEHRARLRQHDHPLSVRIGGPLLNDNGQMCGTMLVVEAETRSDVEAFLKADPYMRAGVYEQVLIHAYNWGLGQPEDEDG